ncbi:MAG: stage IV sporulation protein A [Clostridia bacterium]
MTNFNLYKDIATRTNGDIYVGVVGPVRSGKSTFIKRFMEVLVLDNIEDKNKRQRALDELPQSADGKSIMTTQPKFVPSEAVKVNFKDNISANIRMIDCVGYIVDGAIGHLEGGKERQVRTPWFDYEIPFTKAAEIGTEKVIREHSTIGVLVTTDGSITDIDRKSYVSAEERVVKELKELGKPFAIVLNTTTPTKAETLKLSDALQEKYSVPVIVKDVINMTEIDISEIMEKILLEFPLKLIETVAPRWIQALSPDNSIIKELVGLMTGAAKDMLKMRDYTKLVSSFSSAGYLDSPEITNMDMGKGRVEMEIKVKPDLFFTVLSEECGHDIPDDFMLFSYIRCLKHAEQEYGKMKGALQEVYDTGYGVVTPLMSEMLLEEPVMIKQGGQYGIKLKASAPSLHIMRVDVETEVSPIVGTEQQSEDLVKSLLTKYENNKNGIWETNIFGKSLNSLVNEGLNNKLHAMPIEARAKMRKTVSKIVNEGKGGVLCILL